MISKLFMQEGLPDIPELALQTKLATQIWQTFFYSTHIIMG